MANDPDIYWPGASGKKYGYWILGLDRTLKNVAGNYIYAKKNAKGNWVPVYIGETGDLSSRVLDGHHQEDCIRRNGATHIHAHTKPGGRQARLDEETDLRANFDTPCNDQ